MTSCIEQGSVWVMNHPDSDHPIYIDGVWIHDHMESALFYGDERLYELYSNLKDAYESGDRIRGVVIFTDIMNYYKHYGE